jgi:hypothetical protein
MFSAEGVYLADHVPSGRKDCSQSMLVAPIPGAAEQEAGEAGDAVTAAPAAAIEVRTAVLALMKADVNRVDELPETNDDLITELLDVDDASVATIEDEDDTGDSYPT